MTTTIYDYGVIPKDYNNNPVDVVRATTDASGATSPVGANGRMLRGSLVDGEWFTIPSVFRLRITGTGTVVIDSKDSLGNITTGVASYTVSGATDQIEFPYAGDDAVMILAHLSGTTAEVI
jgi:hypothetical protein